MVWTKTKNVWSPDPADTTAEINVQHTHMLASTWGVNLPASTKEDGAVQKMLTDYLRGCMRRLGQSGWSLLGAFAFSAGYPANSFHMAASQAMIDGLTLTEQGTGLASDTDNQYQLAAPPASGTWYDLVYLELFLVEVPGSTLSTPVATNKPDTGHVYKWGNVLYGGTNPTDDINEASYEIRRRVQVQHRIRTVSNVDFATHPNGLDDTTKVFAQGPNASATAKTFAAVPGDAGLWIAGTGTVADQSTLGTLDGYVYAIPVAKVLRTAGVTQIGSGDVTDLRRLWGGISIGEMLTTKGDLPTFSSFPIRLGAGPTGTALWADSTQASGLRWGAPVFSQVTAKSAAYTVIAEDLGTLFLVSGATALTLTALGTLTATIPTFVCGVRNTGTAIATLMAAAADTLNGAAGGSLTLHPNESVLLVGNGTTWQALNLTRRMGVSAKSAAYTAVVDDLGRLLNATGTWTLTLTAPATLGDGWWIAVDNSGSGTITVTPAAGAIDGATSLSVPAGFKTIIVCDGANFVTVAYGNTSPVLVVGQCQLRYSSATQVALMPYGGNLIRIAGALYKIPSGGVIANNTGVYVNGVAGQNLAASTLYYLFVFNNSGTLTIDFRSSATHSTDATDGNVGTEILFGDSSRTLVGMVHTNALAQFQDTEQNRLVASWFNRRPRSAHASDALAVTTTSLSDVEVASGDRVAFVSWADAPPAYAAMFSITNQVAGDDVFVAMYLSGTAVSGVQYVDGAPSTSGYPMPASVVGSFGADISTDGYYYASLYWHVFGSTGTIKNRTVALTMFI